MVALLKRSLLAIVPCSDRYNCKVAPAPLHYMSDELHRIIPAPPPQTVQEAFATRQATSQFYQEVRSRHAFNVYCHWYYTTAERHRQELKQMRRELNILSLFRWRKR